MDIINHFGVYGICLESSKLLCIEKNVGPYRGRLDLPGGSQKNGEGLTDTLIREILEETGYTVLAYSNSRAYDIFIRESNTELMVHHIMVFYDFKIDLRKVKKDLPLLVEDGINDSISKSWIKLEEITEENSSPLVLRAKQELLGESNLDKIIYNEWDPK